MIHGPDPYTQALADLDELLAKHDIPDLQRRLIESEKQRGVVTGAARSLAHAIGNALRHGDIVNDSITPCVNALRQWQQIDQ